MVCGGLFCFGFWVGVFYVGLVFCFLGRFFCKLGNILELFS